MHPGTSIKVTREELEKLRNELFIRFEERCMLLGTSLGDEIALEHWEDRILKDREDAKVVELKKTGKFVGGQGLFSVMLAIKKVPESYLDCRRPPLCVAMLLEGDVTIVEAVKSLEVKGYFSPHPRPWRLGFHDRGHGQGDFAVLDRFGGLVAMIDSKSDAELIIVAVNANIAEAVQTLEDEADQLERWANETRSPMGQLTRLGDEMVARATALRFRANSLRTG